MKYQLKDEFDLLSFLKTIDGCRGEVLFESSRGDQLNLKSQLSKYLFLTLKPGDPYLSGSQVECSEEDGEKLSGFLKTLE